MRKGGAVSIIGFGNLSVVKRAGRKRRNPATREAFKLLALKVPKTTSGAAFKPSIGGK
ncbi:MAG: HU family DNA-binding protein [Betaproteobacteria bacterium]|nr:HU family DNA-binding protein [Betaproteobacteria bacterium]